MDGFTNADMFSNIPMHLMVLIVSYLSLGDAFRLCAAKKEWYNECLWRHCTSVDLHEQSFLEVPRRAQLASIGQGSRARAIRDLGKIRYVHFINTTLASIVSPVLSTFKLQFSFERQCKANITDWITYAISKKVENLDLDFSDLDPLSWRNMQFPPISKYILPQILFQHGESIKFLSLTACRLFYHLNFYSFRTLTVLVMKTVAISSGKVSDTLLDCPFLEDLVMIDCYDLRKIEFCFGLERLKRLVVRNCEPLNSGIELVYIPQLEYFEYIGCFVRFEVDGLDAIHEVILDFQIDSDQPHDRNKMQESLSGFTQATILTISMHTYKVLPQQYMSYPEFLILPSLSKLTLITCMSKYELAGILTLLKSAPYLTTLSILTFMRPGDVTTFGYDCLELPDGFWTLQDWDLNHLTYVEIAGLTGKETEYDVLKFLMKNAANLNKLSITALIRENVEIYREVILQMEAASESLVIEWCNE